MGSSGALCDGRPRRPLEAVSGQTHVAQACGLRAGTWTLQSLWRSLAVPSILKGQAHLGAFLQDAAYGQASFQAANAQGIRSCRSAIGDRSPEVAACRHQEAPPRHRTAARPHGRPRARPASLSCLSRRMRDDRARSCERFSRDLSSPLQHLLLTCARTIWTSRMLVTCRRMPCPRRHGRMAPQDLPCCIQFEPGASRLDDSHSR